MASGIHIVVLLCSAAAIFLIASVYVTPIACLPDLKRKIPLLWFSLRLFFFLFKVFRVFFSQVWSFPTCWLFPYDDFMWALCAKDFKSILCSQWVFLNPLSLLFWAHPDWNAIQCSVPCVCFRGFKDLPIHNVILPMDNATVETFHHTWEDCFLFVCFLYLYLCGGIIQIRGYVSQWMQSK